MNDSGTSSSRAVDALGLGRDLALGELAHRVAHLLEQLVERPAVAPARLRACGRSRAAPTRVPRARRSARSSAREGRARAPRRRGRGRRRAGSRRSRTLAHWSADAGDAGRSKLSLRAALGCAAIERREQLARGARLRRGVGDALDQHLVVVDLRAALR